jgi:hypothetical protein
VAKAVESYSGGGTGMTSPIDALVWSRCGPTAAPGPPTRMETQPLYLLV